MIDRPSVFRTLAVFWTLVILVLVSIPGESLPGVDLLEADKLVHAAMFAGFAFLWLGALPGRLRRRLAWVVGFGSAFAVLTEVYQGAIPLGRTADPLDAVANLIGLLLGVGLHLAWAAWRTRKVNLQ